MSASGLQALSIGAFIVFFVFLGLSIYLFFHDRILDVMNDLNGNKAQKQIQRGFERRSTQNHEAYDRLLNAEKSRSSRNRVTAKLAVQTLATEEMNDEGATELLEAETELLQESDKGPVNFEITDCITYIQTDEVL